MKIIKNENVVLLIKDYLQAVKEGIKSLNQKYLKDPTFHQIKDDDDSFQNHGFTEEDESIYYEFHGPNGCYMKWKNGRAVDFNVGTAGRCDEFSPWFVLDFYENNSDINNKYPELTIEDIKAAIGDLLENGEIVEDKFYRLFLFKEDYDNPSPFRWAGGEYLSDDNE